MIVVHLHVSKHLKIKGLTCAHTCTHNDDGDEHANTL